ncbi:hypothetical protein GO497_21505 [Acidovorax citrulli]|nr:hypothetical protein [Paracidovorax citrulli]
MSQTQDVAVTYIGNDEPFKDRLYRSGLTFARGQTRLVPAPLAARFLQHTDVFKGADAGAAEDATQQGALAKQADDTQQQLAEAKRRKTSSASRTMPVSHCWTPSNPWTSRRSSRSRPTSSARSCTRTPARPSCATW